MSTSLYTAKLIDLDRDKTATRLRGDDYGNLLANVLFMLESGHPEAVGLIRDNHDGKVARFKRTAIVD